MPRRKTVFEPGQICHIYNRGAGRANIFQHRADYESLIQLLQTHHDTFGVTLLVYCLLPNHFHLLVSLDPQARLARFMQAVFSAYTQSFNHRHDRVGTLFESRFKALVIDTDAYRQTTCRYIHLNPVAAGLSDTPADWPYSNYWECQLGNDPRGGLCAVDRVLDWFGGARAYVDYVHDGLARLGQDSLSTYFHQN